MKKKIRTLAEDKAIAEEAKKRTYPKPKWMTPVDGTEKKWLKFKSQIGSGF